jgi:hypothetical protein
MKQEAFEEAEIERLTQIAREELVRIGYLCAILACVCGR